MYKKLLAPVLPLFITGLLFSCGGGSDGEPDVKEVKIDIQTRRLDRDLIALDTNNIGAGLTKLAERYPDFLDFYLDTLMGFGIQGRYQDSVPAVKNGLRVFLTHHDYRGVFDSVAVHYPDTKDIDEDLKKGFQYRKHYFPGSSVPRIVYLVSGLNNMSAFTYDSTIIGIGLDMYLGEHYPFYASVGIPAYISNKLKPEYIASNVFQAVYREQQPFVMEGKTLLDLMIQRGKEQYYLSKIVPFASDTVRLGFTKAELDWCVASEAQIYNFFIKDNLLYETNWQKILRYVNDGPTSTGMPAESPGNVGSWLGFQIVKAYVKQHPGVALAELIKPMDAQRFLQESKYKPK